MHNLKNCKGILLLCISLAAVAGCKEESVLKADKQVEAPLTTPTEAPVQTAKPEPTPTEVPEQEQVTVTPEVQVLHTETEFNSAGETVRSVYTLEGDIVVLNKYKQDVLVHQEKWNEGALEFSDEGVFQTPELSFWCRSLDGEDIHATTYTEFYTDTMGTLHRLIRGTSDGEILYDEVHEYGEYYREDGVLILTEKVYLNGVLGAEAEYRYFRTKVIEKRPIELDFYPVKGASIALGHQEGNSAFLDVTEDDSYELSSHIRECYIRDEEGQLVSGQVYVDGVLKEEYEFAPGGYFIRSNDMDAHAKTVTTYLDDGTTIVTRYNENGEQIPD